MSVYSSFLLRCWLKRGDAPDSYIIEHVQSGEQMRAHTAAELLAWIEANSERLASAAVEPEGEEENEKSEEAES